MPADLDGPLAKVDRAAEHTKDLIFRLNEWRALPSHEIVLKENPDNPSRLIATVESVQEIPVYVPIILGEIMYNLGSALDQLICALKIRNGCDCAHNSSFPIRDTTKDFEEALGQIGGLDAPTIEKIKWLEPYKDGDRILWPLRQLYNHDKHRALMAVLASQKRRFRQRVTNIPDLAIEIWNDSSPHQVLKAGDVFNFPKPSDEVEARLSVEVAFDEPDIFGQELVITGRFNLAAVKRIRGIICSFK